MPSSRPRHALIFVLALHLIAAACAGAAPPPVAPPVPPSPVGAAARTPPPPPPPVETGEGGLPAPTRLHPTPDLYLLLELPGDRSEIRYTPGSLDRSANLIHRLDLVARMFHRWTGLRPEIRGYVLSRDEWQNRARLRVPYGIPVRADEALTVVMPAFADPEMVSLWTSLLGGAMPSVPGQPMRGTAQEAAALVVSDLMAQLLVAEALVDEAGLAGDAFWVRGLMAHVVSVALMERLEPTRVADLDALYAVAERRYPGHRSARDYGPDVSLADWLWFQAQFHRGAQLLVAEEGKNDVVKRMTKLRKKGDGRLEGGELLRRYRALDEWFHRTFSAVSLVR